MCHHGMVYNIQRYSLDDGPGIRTTVFLKGCPLRCAWCSNPESQSCRAEISHRSALCVGCGRCASACPQGAITLKEFKFHLDRQLCQSCGICADTCIHGANVVVGQNMSVDEVMKIVIRDRAFYEESGGGMTLSGGEILAQHEFAGALLKTAGREGIHTCIETSGFGSHRAIEDVFPYADLIYFDMKHGDPIFHKRYTGQENLTIRSNLEQALRMKKHLVIRIPVIPTVNAGAEAIDQMIHLLTGLENASQIEAVHLLPYHNYGEPKYDQLQRDYACAGIKRPDEEIMNRAKAQFLQAGFDCRIV